VVVPGDCSDNQEPVHSLFPLSSASSGYSSFLCLIDGDNREDSIDNPTAGAARELKMLSIFGSAIRAIIKSTHLNSQYLADS